MSKECHNHKNAIPCHLCTSSTVKFIESRMPAHDQEVIKLEAGIMSDLINAFKTATLAERQRCAEVARKFNNGDVIAKAIKDKEL